MSALTTPKKYPVAAKAGFGNKRSATDMVTAKLAALQFYQLAIPPPTPPPGSYDQAAASRGEAIFKGKAACAQCHVPPLFTEPGWNTHKASDIGIDDFQAKRSPDNTYRTGPLGGLFAHMKGGFYHDGKEFKPDRSRALSIPRWQIMSAVKPLRRRMN